MTNLSLKSVIEAALTMNEEEGDLFTYWERIKSSKGLNSNERSSEADSALVRFLLMQLESGAKINTQQAAKHMQQIASKLTSGGSQDEPQ